MRHILRRLPHFRLLPVALVTVGASVSQQGVGQEVDTNFAAVFDEHWQRLHDDYPYFELYGVDWEAERDDHRPRAVAAEPEKSELESSS